MKRETANQKTRYQNLLVIGSTGRNVGKTTLLCQIIHTIAEEQPVYAIKASVISPDRLDEKENAIQPGIFEETRYDTRKDTSRMLRAGAKRVFYLQKEGKLLEGFLKILQKIPPASAIVCESNSLSHYLQPGLFLVVRPENRELTPKEILRTKNGDLLIPSDGISGFPNHTIQFSHGEWCIVEPHN